MLIVSCPECKKELKVKDDLAGKKVKCPGCGSAFVIAPPVPETIDAPALARPPVSEDITSQRPRAADDAPRPPGGDAVESGADGDADSPKRSRRRAKTPKEKSKV